MKKAIVTQTSITTYGGTKDIIARDFNLKEGYALATVRMNKGRSTTVFFDGQSINADDVDSVIAVLKTTKKMLKLTVDSKKAIFDLTVEDRG